MDALTWFKTVFHRAQANPTALRADLATERWADVPLPPVPARPRPPAVPAGHDGDWDAVIARARMQVAAPRSPSRPPPIPAEALPDMPPTPPPVATPEAAAARPRLPRPSSARRATPKARPSPPPRNLVPEASVTPPPVPTAPQVPAHATAEPKAKPSASWAGDPEQLKARLDALASGRARAARSTR